MSTDTITMAPHHYVDILISYGAGARTFAPHPYGHAVHTLSARILEEPDVPMRLGFCPDGICTPCRFYDGARCNDIFPPEFAPAAPRAKMELNRMLDLRWYERLGARPGDTFTARGLAERIRERMGETADIYREIHTDEECAERQANLVRGIAVVMER
jgi:hypothetical protein